MVITVTLPTAQAAPQPGWDNLRQVEVTLLSRSTLADLIPDSGVDLQPDKIVMEINGRAAGLETVLLDGDLVILIPANAGDQAG